MADVHDIETRSYNMSRIRCKNTKPEIIVRKYLHLQGLRFRLHDKTLPAKPDLVLRKYKSVVFVNGCFWHGHDECKYFKKPKTNTNWWLLKIDKTIKRDSDSIAKLKTLGWNSIVLWECELKPQKRNRTLQNLLIKITQNPRD